MNYLPQLNLLTKITFAFCLFVFPSKVVFADDYVSIKADELMALNPSKQSPHNQGLLAWKYGVIYHLDANLNAIKKIVEYDELTIKNVTQVSNSLFILTNSDIKNKEGETVDSIDIVIEYDLSKGI
ncbi:MAG: hypothetical protein V3V22_06535 [Methylococcales bacterium]